MIERDKLSIHSEKEKIDKLSVLLESLQYQKQTLTNNIRVCQSVQLLGTDRLSFGQEMLRRDLIVEKDSLRGRYFIS
jgi:hypothetical protein